jgi:predicted ATPase/class 3 adenylate cyclase
VQRHTDACSIVSLFTDVEGSTRLWEQRPQDMRVALERHDAIARAAVQRHHGIVVKSVGDGVHAAFDDPLDAVLAAVELQRGLADRVGAGELTLRVRCGMHVGIVERRDDDFFGSAVNRAARIMATAHGGQVLVSQAVAEDVGDRLPSDITLRDLGSVRLRDLARPERIHQVEHAALRQDFPALRSLESTPNNLPQQVTSFVGREADVARVRALLRGARLVTLVGLGGLGKTRLAVQVAAEVLDDYPDGVWLVELASVSDARMVPQAAASVLGVKEDAGRPVLEALVRHVADRTLLLVLDNCEHLLGPCAALVRALLVAEPGLRVLATAREQLRMAGEVTHTVSPLEVPDAQQATSVEEARRCEAVRLFVDRATLVQPAFALGASNVAAVSAICARLDGIPLALELAAARAGTLTIDSIAQRLDDRFKLLSRGSRAALPRQQTLRALIDWSYELLSPPEKTLFARLAVFAGGFTFEAAQAVGAGDGIDASQVADLATALADKSLVELDAEGARYRLLETVRQYAQDRLDASVDSVATRERHLAYFVDLAERIHARLWGPEQGRWLARLDPDRENLLAAHAWCDRARDGASLGLRLVYATQLYWLPRGLIELGYRVTQEALARAGAGTHDKHRSGALYAASQLAYFIGAYAASRAHAEESLAIAREGGHHDRAAAALLLRGYCADAEHDAPLAQASFEASADLARQLGDRERLSFALNALAGHHAEVGNLARAQALFEESVQLGRELGDQDSLAIVLTNLARLLVDRGDARRAPALLVEALGIAGAIGSTRGGQNAIEVAVGLAVLQGDWARAARLFGAVEAVLAQLHMRRTPADETFLHGQITRARAGIGDGFDEARMQGATLSYDQALDEVEGWLKAPAAQRAGR